MRYKNYQKQIYLKNSNLCKSNLHGLRNQKLISWTVSSSWHMSIQINLRITLVRYSNTTMMWNKLRENSSNWIFWSWTYANWSLWDSPMLHLHRIVTDPYNLAYYIIFLSATSHNIPTIIIKSYKSRRTRRSPMNAKVLLFVFLFDTADALDNDLHSVPEKIIPLQRFTDSKCIFGKISSGSRSIEKKTSIDLAAAADGFRYGPISDIGFCRRINQRCGRNK